MKRGIIYGVVLFFITVLLTSLNIKTKLTNSKIRQECISEQKLMTKDYLERDQILFHVQNNISRIVGNAEILINSNGVVAKEFLILFIPGDVCWDCLEQHIRDISTLAESFHLSLILFCQKPHFRDLLIFSQDFNYVHAMSSFHDPIFKQLGQNLLFVIYEPEVDHIMTYIELKGDVTIENLITYYFSRLNKS